MATISAADVKRLRDLTSAGMMECKKALEESGGDMDAAVEILRISGAAKAAKQVVWCCWRCMMPSLQYPPNIQMIVYSFCSENFLSLVCV